MKFTYGDVPRMFVGSLGTGLVGIAFSIQYYTQFGVVDNMWIYLTVLSVAQALLVPAHVNNTLFFVLRLLFYAVMLAGLVLCLVWSKGLVEIGLVVLVAGLSVVCTNWLIRALSSNEI